MPEGVKCENKGCEYQCTGIVPQYCCMKCREIPGQHGPRCRKTLVCKELKVEHCSSRSSWKGQGYNENDEFEKLICEYLYGKRGENPGYLPDEIKTKRVPKSKGIVAVCRSLKTIHYSESTGLIYPITVEAVTDAPREKLAFSTTTSECTRGIICDKFDKMSKEKLHFWKYKWFYIQCQLEDSSYFWKCRVYISNTGSDTPDYVDGFSYGHNLVMSEAQAMEQILDMWDKESEKIAERLHVIDENSEAAKKLAEVVDRLPYDPENAVDDVVKVMVSSVEPLARKVYLNIFEAALRLANPTPMHRFILALSAGEVDAKMFAEMLKIMAKDITRRLTTAQKAETTLRNMKRMRVRMSPYGRDMMAAVIQEEIESCRTGRHTFRSTFDLCCDEKDEEKKAIPVERQIDALCSLECGASFDHTVSRICLGSWNVCKNAVHDVDDDFVLQQYQSLCAKRPNDALEYDVEPSTKQNLTDTQKRIVHAAMKNTITCVRGPPGTGKTFTACAVINEWVQRGNLRVLAVAQSNAACGHLAAQLARFDVDAVRLGASLSVEDLLAQPAFCSKLDEDEMSAFMAETTNERPKLMPFLKMVVERATVVVTSCIASGHPGLLSSVRFHRVLMEEAGQITEATAMVPLWWGAKGTVLIGDERQLPPTVLSNDDTNPLKRSFFERLILDKLVTEEEGTFLMLDTQYRMHPSLAYFPRHMTYHDQVLRDHPSVFHNRPPIQGFHWPQDKRAIFVDVGKLGKEEQENLSASYYNRREAMEVISLLQHFLNNGVQKQDIAIVAAYSAQVNVLKSLYFQSRTDQVKIATADSFQGSEKPLILFSTVRSGTNVGFLSSTQRCNVIMTRAQSGLVVFGSRDTLQNEPQYWRPWIEWIEKENCYIRLEDLRTYFVSVPTLPLYDRGKGPVDPPGAANMNVWSATNVSHVGASRAPHGARSDHARASRAIYGTHSDSTHSADRDIIDSVNDTSSALGDPGNGSRGASMDHACATDTQHNTQRTATYGPHCDTKNALSSKTSIDPSRTADGSFGESWNWSSGAQYDTQNAPSGTCVDAPHAPDGSPTEWWSTTSGAHGDVCDAWSGRYDDPARTTDGGAVWHTTSDAFHGDPWNAPSGTYNDPPYAANGSPEGPWSEAIGAHGDAWNASSGAWNDHNWTADGGVAWHATTGARGDTWVDSREKYIDPVCGADVDSGESWNATYEAHKDLKNASSETYIIHARPQNRGLGPSCYNAGEAYEDPTNDSCGTYIRPAYVTSSQHSNPHTATSEAHREIKNASSRLRIVPTRAKDGELVGQSSANGKAHLNPRGASSGTCVDRTNARRTHHGIPRAATSGVPCDIGKAPSVNFADSTYVGGKQHCNPQTATLRTHCDARNASSSEPHIDPTLVTDGGPVGLSNVSSETHWNPRSSSDGIYIEVAQKADEGSAQSLNGVSTAQWNPRLASRWNRVNVAHEIGAQHGTPHTTTSGVYCEKTNTSPRGPFIDIRNTTNGEPVGSWDATWRAQSDPRTALSGACRDPAQAADGGPSEPLRDMRAAQWNLRCTSNENYVDSAYISGAQHKTLHTATRTAQCDAKNEWLSGANTDPTRGTNRGLAHSSAAGSRAHWDRESAPIATCINPTQGADNGQVRPCNAANGEHLKPRSVPNGACSAPTYAAAQCSTPQTTANGTPAGANNGCSKLVETWSTPCRVPNRYAVPSKPPPRRPTYVDPPSAPSHTQLQHSENQIFGSY